jgi:hypothetical protein
MAEQICCIDLASQAASALLHQRHASNRPIIDASSKSQIGESSPGNNRYQATLGGIRAPPRARCTPPDIFDFRTRHQDWLNVALFRFRLSNGWVWLSAGRALRFDRTDLEQFVSANRVQPRTISTPSDVGQPISRLANLVQFRERTSKPLFGSRIHEMDVYASVRARHQHAVNMPEMPN